VAPLVIELPVDVRISDGQISNEVSDVQRRIQQLGRGRGGAPFAWNDQNKDGICDVTGKPVGQGRTVGFGGGRGRRIVR
jgi:hypothetical protein